MVRTRGVFVQRVLRTFRHRSALSAARSTNLWLRNNSPDGKRSHMTAFVSDNDGATWKGRLLLDERMPRLRRPCCKQLGHPPFYHCSTRDTPRCNCENHEHSNY
jgi:hypothetical protein